MKKSPFYITAILLISTTFISCEKDQILEPNKDFTGVNPNSTTTTTPATGSTTDLVVLERQRAIVTYVGATWCPPCGAYGDPTKVHMENSFKGDVIILNVQSNDAISSATAFGPKFGNEFQSFVGSNSIPHAYWSGANFAMVDRGFFTSPTSNNNAADGNINSIISDRPEVGVSAKASIKDGEVNIETLTKFFRASTTEHFIGIYLLEDGVEAMQQISGSPAAVTSHENVIRGSVFTTNDLGTKSIGKTFKEDETVLDNYSLRIPSSVNDQKKLQVAVVIWEANEADGISNAIIVDVK